MTGHIGQTPLDPVMVIGQLFMFDSKKVEEICLALTPEGRKKELEELEGKGITVTVPTYESPVCHLACILDPDGNTVWIHQRKDGSYGD